ncbi:MAG: FkbM family methyltransferase [Cyclobacteriaceae bacterium]
MIEQLLRFLPPFRGKHRLARLLLKGRIKANQEAIVWGRFRCRYKIPNIYENVGFEIYINGIYEPNTVSFIIKRIKRNGSFLDIGANIGAISIPVVTLRPDISGIGVEASPRVFDYLSWNIRINQLSNISIVNNAMSNRDDQTVDFFSPLDKFGKGSLAPIFTNDSVEVKTITLDEFSTKQEVPIDFIKVDVEGFESLIFEGGSELLKGMQAPEILFEFVDWAEESAGQLPGSAQTRLLDFGYNLYDFKNGKIGKKLDRPIQKGASMIFATKCLF